MHLETILRLRTAIAALIALVCTGQVLALPLYSARAGRSCSVCHVDPQRDYPGKGWMNPEPAARKRSLACSVCHVDPTGGGQRTTAGRYYERSTLAMVATEQRAAEDAPRDLLEILQAWRAQKTDVSAEIAEPITDPSADPAPVNPDAPVPTPTSQPEANLEDRTEPDQDDELLSPAKKKASKGKRSIDPDELEEEKKAEKKAEKNEEKKAGPGGTIAVEPGEEGTDPEQAEQPPRRKRLQEEPTVFELPDEGSPPPELSRFRHLLHEGMERGYQSITIPDAYPRAHRKAKGGPVWGNPYWPISEYAPWDGRYANLSADPLLAAGLDARMGYWSEGHHVFPMQADLHGSVHPVEHLTVATTFGLRGRYEDLVPERQDGDLPFRFHRLYIMTHEWPYQSYARFGRLDNPFGLKIDDHTSPFRRQLELDLGRDEALVDGLELGLAPEEPYGHLAVYRNLTAEGFPEEADPGLGATLSGGYRRADWHAGGSVMFKDRELAAGGTLFAAGLNGSVNPFAWSPYVPVTLLFELDYARRQRVISGSTASALLGYAELGYFPFNGLSLRAKYDHLEPDLEVAGDFESRYTLSFEVVPYPGVGLTWQNRWLVPEEGERAFDIFVSAHVWF